jgi:ligand-binding SRPBCC domain-containing protein
MKGYRLEREQVVRIPLDRAFSFFADPHSLVILTPGFVNLRFIKDPPKVVTPGLLLDYRIRLYGVGLRWQSRIESVDPPHEFLDIQTKGPYSYWHHCHTFEEAGSGATLIRDRVDYGLPLGPLGSIAYHLFVERSLRDIFDFRERKLAELVVGGTAG